MKLRNLVTLSLLALVTAVMALAAGQAGAATLCVNKPPCLTGTAYPADGLQQALDDAADSKAADTIYIGPAEDPYEGTFIYGSESPLELIGSGSQETVLTSGNFGPVLALPVPDVEVSRLGIDVRSVAGFTGLELRGRASEVAIRQVGDGEAGAIGLELIKDGRFERGSVTMAKGLALSVAGTGLRSVADSRLASSSVTVETSGRLDLLRSEVRAGSAAVLALGDAATTVLNSDLITTVGGGVEASNGADVIARNLTVVKRHADGNPALASYGTIVGHQTSVKLSNSILSGFSVPFRRAGKVDSPAALSVAYSAWTGTPEDGAGGGAIEILDGNRANTEAEFANPDPIDPLSAPDYRLRFGSALIDAGDPGTPAGLELDGKERSLDGDGDGSARADLGAYEYGPVKVREPETVPPASGGPARGGIPPAPRAGIARALIGRGLAAPDRRGRMALRLACSAEGPCTGRVALLRGKRGLAVAPFKLAAGTTATVRLQLRPAVAASLAAERAPRLEVRSRQSDGSVVLRRLKAPLRG